MSIDSYFCLCCLSTNDLMNLFNEKSDVNYVTILDELFSIKPAKEDYEYDGYICTECGKSLTDAIGFKRKVLNTLNVLQVNGLIKINKTNDRTVITKVLNEYVSDVEEKYIILEEEKVNTEAHAGEEIKQDFEHTLKLEETLTPEREKRITVPRKKKKEPSVKSEVLYEVTEDFKCTVCAAVLPNVYVYHSHMNKHFPNHICETCGKGFLTKKRLKRHQPSHIKGPFKCGECDMEFSNYNTMNSHRQRKHKPVLLYKCPHCAMRFGTLTRRARHLAAQHGARAQHQCALCSHSFLLAGNLSTHMRNKHLKVKRHFCVECGMGFFHKQELTGHMASHTGRNEFQCSLCPKSYPRKKALEVHMRRHRDDRRFCCEHCGKKFLQKCTLIRHTKTHTRTEEKIVTSENKDL